MSLLTWLVVLASVQAGLVIGLGVFVLAQFGHRRRLGRLEIRYGAERTRPDFAERERLRNHLDELRAAGHGDGSPDVISAKRRLGEGD